MCRVQDGKICDIFCQPFRLVLALHVVSFVVFALSLSVSFCVFFLLLDRGHVRLTDFGKYSTDVAVVDFNLHYTLTDEFYKLFLFSCHPGLSKEGITTTNLTHTFCGTPGKNWKLGFIANAS